MATRRGYDLGLCCLLIAGATTSLAHALPFSPNVSHRHTQSPSPNDDVNEDADASFAKHFGLEAAQESLNAGGSLRMRQLRQFAAYEATPDSFQEQIARVLHKWLVEEPALTPEETLAVVQALAPLNRQALARKHLVRLVVSSAPASGRDTKSPGINSAHIRQLTARMAALALARSQHPDALGELGQWLRRPTPEAEYAAEALVLATPGDLAPILKAPGPVTPLLLRTLRRLRDPKSEAFLRQVLKRATAPVQAEAALSLLALGVDGTLELALHWLDQAELAPELLWASTHVLFHHRHPARTAALRRLFEARPSLVLDIAAQYTDPELLVLGDHLSAFNLVERQQVLTNLARLEQLAVPLLVRTLSDFPDLAVPTAALLARQTAPEASIALREFVQRELAKGKPASQGNIPTRNPSNLSVLALAVAAVRGSSHQEDVQAFLESLVAGASGSKRRATDLALAALDVAWAQKLLKSDEPVELGTAARVVGLHGADYKRAVVARLSEFLAQPLDPRALALSPVVSALAADDTLPIGLLRAWAHSSLPVAYPAVWQLCTRLQVQTMEPLDPWLASADPELRAAAYLGLGSNQEPNYTALLLSALNTETDVWVRRSVIAALILRPQIAPVRKALQYERNYNPDSSVQQLLRGVARSQGKDFWFADEIQPKNRSEWVTVTQSAHSPMAVTVAPDLPPLVFMPDNRTFEAGTYHVRTFAAPLTPPPRN